MRGDRQLDDAETRAEVPAGDRHGGDHFLAQLVGQLRQLLLAQGADIAGKLHGIEQRRVGTVAHRGRAYAVSAAKSPTRGDFSNYSGNAQRLGPMPLDKLD
jgi:hypothetical protein